jgi:hypothetical protein
MAVDQHRVAELLMGAAEQRLQRLVVRLVDRVDPAERLGDGQPAGIDVEPLADHLGDRAETAGNARRPDVCERGHRVREHARIEFPGLAIDVEIGARKIRGKQRRAERRGRAEQFVDEAILGAPDRHPVEPGHGEETVGIVAAAVRGIEYEGNALPVAAANVEGCGRREIVGRRHVPSPRKSPRFMASSLPSEGPRVQQHHRSRRRSDAPPPPGAAMPHSLDVYPLHVICKMVNGTARATWFGTVDWDRIHNGTHTSG